MFLGQAKIRVNQIKDYIEWEKFALNKCPVNSVVSMLEHCNKLLQEKQSLQKRIKETEETTELEGNSLSDVQLLFSVVEEKVNLLESLSQREDLKLEQKESLFNQLKTYRETKDTLYSNIQKCLWETELLGE